MGFWDPCWACRLMRGEIQGGVVVAMADVVVAINPFPLVDGHVLVMPRQHVPNIFDMPAGLAGPVLAMAARVARAQQVAFQAEGVTLRQNNGAASDQHLMHFHLHVIPRYTGDTEAFGREPEQISEQRQHALAARLVEALAHLD